MVIKADTQESPVSADSSAPPEPEATLPPRQPQSPIATKSTTAALYGTPRDALDAVRTDYLYWTGRVTDTSLQLSFAVIAANWAVFGSIDAVLGNVWAKLSIALVVCSLGVSLVAAHVLGVLHSRRIDYAESDPDRWKREFDTTAGVRDPWPFTGAIESFGFWQRTAKTWLPVAAALLFLIALLSR